MISVGAHPIALDAVRNIMLPEEIDHLAERRRLDAAAGPELDADQLGTQLRFLYRTLDLFVGGDPTWPELLYWAKAFVRGSAALFTYRRCPERSRWRLRGHDRLIVGTSDPSSFSDTAWTRAFWLAFAVRDACSLALLVQTPVTLIEATEAYKPALIGAIQSTFARLPATGTRIIEALALADPDKTTRTWGPALLDLVVPVFEPLFALADRDESRLTASLTKLLELRRAYYLREKYDEDEKWDGRDEDNLSAAGIGLVAWGRTLGMNIEVKSGYVPTQLLEVPAAEVETCRSCSTPSDDDDLQARCHACDAPRENTLTFGFAEWIALERQPCAACHHAFPLLAKRCPVCIAPRGS